MKKIFFVLVTIILYQNAFSQKDSIINKFTVGVSPIRFVSPNEDIFYCEYRPKKKISFELGGGYFNLLEHPFPDKGTFGYTVHTGIKFYKSGKKDYPGDTYREILFFYRQVQYKNRFYGESSDTNPLFEQDYFTLGAGEHKNSKYGDELKQVICLKVLWGKEVFLGKKEHLVFEYFGGFGLRVKFRYITITQEQSGYDFIPVSPYKEHTDGLLPSIHFGIKLGYKF